MKPYIFLTENFFTNAQYMNENALNIRTIAATTPFAQEVFFTDRYGNVVNRTVDTLILQDTNIVNMTLEMADNQGNFTPFITLTDNTSSTVILKMPQPVTTNAVRMVIPETGNPGDISAKIGLHGFLCNLYALTDSNYKIDANAGSYRVLSGTYIHWADYKKWVAKVKMENVTLEQFNLLTAQVDTGEMTLIPYKDLAVNAIYECAVGREYSYELNRKTGLFNLELEFNEL